MLDLSQDIDSLSSFKRETPEYLRRMRKSGRPVVLTINGKAELVVQDVASYQRLLKQAERMAALDAIEAGLQDVDAGRTTPAREVIAGLQRSLATPRRHAARQR